MGKVSPTTIGVWLLGIGLCAAGYGLYEGNARLAAVERRLAAREAVLDGIHAEVTRIRIEQSAGIKGPAGLLEKLRTYAPLLVSSSTAEPDYAMAKAEMEAVLRAFQSIGSDAREAITARWAELDPAKHFDELKWLLEAAVAVDRKPGLELARRVLLGIEKPSPRLRWYAADLLLREDKPIAQAALRQILLSESSRGINLERAAAYGASIPDPAAYATTGFNNFVVKYVRSGDSEIDETLLMVMGRSEHDQITVQECVEALGKRKCARAVEAIEKLYLKPPGFQENPLFQMRCLDALAEIQGDGARPFFEKVLPDATTETVANHLKRLLGRPVEPKNAAVAPRGGQQPQGAGSNSIAPPGRK